MSYVHCFNSIIVVFLDRNHAVPGSGDSMRCCMIPLGERDFSVVWKNESASREAEGR